ncbi:MAG: ribosome assembly factor SBDS [Candidatus Heimdallarchaeota archaeon]|nr:ribosome assembly factor SBDS [Candidatus Heimdallarchaeota archaeon]
MSFNRSPGDRSTRVDLGNLTLVKYSTHGKKLEIIVEPEKAWLFTQGEDIPLDEIVEGYTVFENISKGLKADLETLSEIFGTDNEREIIIHILQKGSLQLTQEQRKQFLKEKREEIIEFLVSRGVNPKTKSPHPASRIEKAMDEAGVKINRNEPAVDQAMRIIKEIQSIIPIKIETATIEFIVPAILSGKMYGMIKGYGDVLNESWGSDGSLTIISRVPAGLVANILEELSDQSKGKIRATVIERSE